MARAQNRHLSDVLPVFREPAMSQDHDYRHHFSLFAPTRNSVDACHKMHGLVSDMHHIVVVHKRAPGELHREVSFMDF